MLSLSDLTVGQEAIIEDLSSSANSARLQELGFLPGTPVRLVRKAPLRDPLQVSVRGFDLSLRRCEAAAVHVRLES